MEKTHHPPSTIHHLVLGTAGHIDHGKTALIKALTGTDTDRLLEEKQRGISIELGYAELKLPSGTAMSVVDVPGHEKFVRNMVAGASGIDIFLLVVAADDGVMPQTREHMAIIRLLGIPQGVVAITKSDLVDEDMLELVRTDVEDFLTKTPYANAPVITVSAKTGKGLPLLLGALEDATAQAAQAHQASAAARLPVDRVFTLKGIGTVATGTLWSGEICTDDNVRVLPGGMPARARSVQVHDRAVSCAEAGQRAAINLAGIGKELLSRGQMIVKGEGLKPVYMVDARITLLDNSPQLKYGAQVRFHHGTAEATAKLMFADRRRLHPGESCFAQARLKKMIVPARGDRFILRSLSPVATIGGGVVIDPAPRKHGQGEAFVRRLGVLETGKPADIVSLLLGEAGMLGMVIKELKISSNLPGNQLNDSLADPAVAAGREAGGDMVYFSPQVLLEMEAIVLQALEKRQKQSPADPSLAADQLAKALELSPSQPSFQALLAGLIASGQVAKAKQRYLLASAEARLSEGQQRLLAGVSSLLEGAGLMPPPVSELASGADGKDLRLILGLLEEHGAVVKAKPDLYFAAGAVEQARLAVVGRCQETGRITLAELRDALGISRKFAQSLLEYFDRSGVTRRVEDYRVLRKLMVDGRW